ncbi:hypothetical protein ACF1BQ_036625 [Bradyrhizobium sp. RDT10]
MTWDHEFNDKRKRWITFDTTGSIRAYFEGKCIGELALRDEEFEGGRCVVYAENVHVDEEFQNARIGLEMLRLAYEQNGPIVPPHRFETNSAKRNTITGDGMRLLLSGQKKGWVAEFPDREEPNDDLDE